MADFLLNTDAGLIESNISESSLLLSPSVRDLASEFYQEFKLLLSHYGDGVVDGITPIIIRALERVDELNEQNESVRAHLLLLEADRQDLQACLERETKLRKIVEQRLHISDDKHTEDIAKMEAQITELTNLVRTISIKNQCSLDHASRLEEKEAQLRIDLTNAQARYNNLLRSHASQLERTRRAKRTRIRQHAIIDSVDAGSASFSPNRSRDLFPQSVNEAHNTSESFGPAENNVDVCCDTEGEAHLSTSANCDHSIAHEPSTQPGILEPICYPGENSLDYDKYFGGLISYAQNDDTDEMVSSVSDGTEEFEDFGLECVENEVRKLITENLDLIENKNALNVLKDDLLAKIDDLTGENILLQNELLAYSGNFKKLKSHLSKSSCFSRFLIDELRIFSDRFFIYGRKRSCSTLNSSHRRSQSSVIVRNRDEGWTSLVKRSKSCGLLESYFHSLMNPPLTPGKLKSDSTTDRKISCSNFDFGPASNSIVSMHCKSSDGSQKPFRLSRRDIARALVERNFYKRKYFELKEEASHFTSCQRVQEDKSNRDSLRKELIKVPSVNSRPHFTSLANQMLQSVQNLASDVVHGFNGLILDESVSTETSKDKESSALWNLLGNFVSQAVTYTADAVIGTGTQFDLSKSPISRPNLDASLDFCQTCETFPLIIRHPVVFQTSEVCRAASNVA